MTDVSSNTQTNPEPNFLVWHLKSEVLAAHLRVHFAFSFLLILVSAVLFLERKYAKPDWANRTEIVGIIADTNWRRAGRHTPPLLVIRPGSPNVYRLNCTAASTHWNNCYRFYRDGKLQRNGTYRFGLITATTDFPLLRHTRSVVVTIHTMDGRELLSFQQSIAKYHRDLVAWRPLIFYVYLGLATLQCAFAGAHTLVRRYRVRSKGDII
jgi:hypothetical protein